ncbi:MAG: lipoprotein-releasing ABC transporter permease subunit [Pseudomonadota bacterium]
MPAMLSPVEFMIALRYLRARQSTRFASFISIASLLGVAIGVAALITILSVMNGFEAELRSRLLGVQSHASVTLPGGVVPDWSTLRARIAADADVVSVRPAVSAEGMASVEGRLIPLLAEGLDPELERSGSDIANAVTTGSLDDLTAGSRRMIVGALLALDLGVRTGDDVTLLIPRVNNGMVEPRLVRFQVAGTFDSGVPDYDAGVAYLHWKDAASLLDIGDSVSALRLNVVDPFRARETVERIAADIGGALTSSDWTRDNASYFRAIKLEKAMMALMLSLVIAVAAFNIIASLVMVVTDKETDIAILRTLGLPADGIVRVFFFQGLIIGWVGVLTGVLVGTLLALNVTEVAAFVERALGFQVMPSDVYVMTRIPSLVVPSNILWIAAIALLLTTLATTYPARRAALVHPADALRYG